MYMYAYIFAYTNSNFGSEKNPTGLEPTFVYQDCPAFR
jgi:hypothetical protein